MPCTSRTRDDAPYWGLGSPGGHMFIRSVASCHGRGSGPHARGGFAESKGNLAISYC
jgi:hypothetical protein